MSGAPDPTPPAPPAERLADRLEARPTRRRSSAAVALHELGAIDRAVYGAIASTPTPTIDEPLRRLSNLAGHSKLWLGVAGAMFGLGGPTGRRAAVTGVVAVGVTSAVVNLPMKFAASAPVRIETRRVCRGRDGYRCPRARHSRQGTRRLGSRSPEPWARRCLGSRSHSAGSLLSSPTHAYTPVCTTPATSSSDR